MKGCMYIIYTIAAGFALLFVLLLGTCCHDHCRYYACAVEDCERLTQLPLKQQGVKSDKGIFECFARNPFGNRIYRLRMSHESAVHLKQAFTKRTSLQWSRFSDNSYDGLSEILAKYPDACTNHMAVDPNLSLWLTFASDCEQSYLYIYVFPH